MRRREFITVVCGAAAAWSSRAHPLQPAMLTIGWLYLGSEDASIRPEIEGFRAGLADLGNTEGKNIRLLYRYANGHADRLSALAIEVVSLGAMVIVTAGIAVRMSG